MFVTTNATILFPCLNEERTIRACVEMGLRALKDNDMTGEVLVADNGSSDSSVEIATRSGARVVHVAEKGYGAALWAGINAAKYENIVMLDSDMTYDLDELPEFMGLLGVGKQLVMGNRFAGGIDRRAMPVLNRLVGNPILSWLARRLYRVEVRDLHCGLRAFVKRDIQSLNLKARGMEFASEMVIIAAMRGLKIGEVSCRLHRCPVDRNPHLRRMSDGWRHVVLLFSAAPRRVFDYLSAILLVPGITVILFSLFGPIRIHERVTLDLGSMTVATMVVLSGLQIRYLGEVNEENQRLTYRLNKRSSREAKRVQMVRVGALSILVGIAGLVWRSLVWFQASLGPLESTTHLRWLILSGALTIIGLLVLVNELLIRIMTFTYGYRERD